MYSADELQKIWIDTREQLGAIPRVLRELHELVPLLSGSTRPMGGRLATKLRKSGEPTYPLRG
jgi:hypothetical protein